MNNFECKMEMLDLYFSKFDFSYDREDKDREFNTSFEIEYFINNDNDSQIKVVVDTSVTNSSQSIIINLQTVGVFQINKEGMSQTEFDTMATKNTVAILFPYIRSQISLMTTQPGMHPIIIPPMNIVSLINTQKK